jgi:ATP-dependent DNA helicase RecG
MGRVYNLNAPSPQKIVAICRSGGYPEPELFEQAGAVYVRFPAGTYVPPTRVSHDLTERQRNILNLLGDGRKWRFQDLYARIENPPSDRTIRQDLILLRELGLVAGEGRGAGARWWLTTDQGERGEGRTMKISGPRAPNAGRKRGEAQPGGRGSHRW